MTPDLLIFCGQFVAIKSNNVDVSFVMRVGTNLSVCLIAGDLSRSAGSGLVTSYSSGRLTFLCVLLLVSSQVVKFCRQKR